MGRMQAGGPRADRVLAARIERWFRANARALPWRTSPRDPYRSLVSEAMLQQTQVARVLEKYDGFIARFPTVRALARADEHDVLAAWSGLGYYRRARNLQAAAKAIVERHGGRVPDDPTALGELPGVGRYTAGALASIVFSRAVPIVDGNVRRVLLRVEGKEIPEVQADAWAWERATTLVARATDPGVFNEGLMELGATVCLPKAPRCSDCPVQDVCRANAEGLQGVIPAPKRRPVVTVTHHAVAVIRDARGRLLVERRPERGLWAGLWQGPALESDARTPSRTQLESHVGVRGLVLRERFDYQTTHRLVRFRVFEGELATGQKPAMGRLVAPGKVADLALSNAHRRILLGRAMAEGRELG